MTVGKVMFLQASVILLTGGGDAIPACIPGGIPAHLAAGLLRGSAAEGGAWSQGVPGPGGVCSGGVWPSVIVTT